VRLGSKNKLAKLFKLENILIFARKTAELMESNQTEVSGAVKN